MLSDWSFLHFTEFLLFKNSVGIFTGIVSNIKSNSYLNNVEEKQSFPEASRFASVLRGIEGTLLVPESISMPREMGSFQSLGKAYKQPPKFRATRKGRGK